MSEETSTNSKSTVLLWIIAGAIVTIAGMALQLFFSDTAVTVREDIVRDLAKSIVVSDKNPLLKLLGQTFIAIGSGVVIALLVIRHIDRKEKSEFEEKLLKFQKQTAQNAIVSAFETLIDRAFLEIVKKDVLGAKLIRFDAVWFYDVAVLKNQHYVLKRTTNYKVRNISGQTHKETIKITTDESIHSSTRIEEISYRHLPDGKWEKKTIKDVKSGIGESFLDHSEEIPLESGARLEVKILIVQNYKNSNYIYDTHFTRYPIENLDVIVKFPDDHRFNLNDSFSSQLELINDQPGSQLYKSKGAIYNGQGIEFLCYKKPK